MFQRNNNTNIIGRVDMNPVLIEYEQCVNVAVSEVKTSVYR